VALSGQLHGPAASLLRKLPPYPRSRRLGGPQSWSGRYDERRNIFALADPRFLGRPIRSLVTLLTELVWLRIGAILYEIIDVLLSVPLNI
jgi:hypothetical protein